MEELDLKSLFNYFINKKLYIILSVVVFLLIGIVYLGFLKTPMYKSSTTILLTKEIDSNTITYNDINLNKGLVDTYREIIKSRKVLGSVKNNLNLDYSIDELNSLVSVSSVNDTEIIRITVVNKDNNLAKDIANETASVFNSEVVKLYNIQNVGVVDVAEVSSVPYNINTLKQLVIFGGIGFVLSVAVIFVVFYFDTTIKTEEEIEDKLNLPVIGRIPRVGGKNE
ncbi:MAG: Wzz/FepE/Etk N-terminal domain-containing protein [bacterium]|nr:Wzz/FepE/Etk N-terminal domain-containing protein [bacterium]